jgi:hypothetical protein
MMLKLLALNDLGDEIASVTITELPLSEKPEQHPLMRQALKLLRDEVAERYGNWLK